MHGVADQVDHDVHQHVAVEPHRRQLLEITGDTNPAVTDQFAVDFDRVTHHILNRADLFDLGCLAESVLHRHDALDVVDLLGQGVQFLHEQHAVRDHLLTQFIDELRDKPAPGVFGDIAAQIISMFPEHGRDFPEVIDRQIARAVERRFRGHIDTV